MIARYPNSTPREDVAAAEEVSTGGAVAAAAVTTLDLTGTTHPMAGFMEWTDPTSGGISPENNLTRPREMGACMYSTSARVTRTPATSRRFSKTGNIL